MSKYQVKVTYSGVNSNSSVSYPQDFYDGQMSVSYLYIMSSYLEDLQKTDYETLLQGSDISHENGLVVLNYEKNNTYLVNQLYWGLYPTSEGTNLYNFYRREYKTFQRYSTAKKEFETKVFVGDWKPVVINNTKGLLRDFNVTNDRSYQYIAFPTVDSNKSKMANDEAPVTTHWECWSLTELIPVKTEVDAPIVKQSYQVDMNNIWLFKYNLETGAQTQNFTKNEIQTLGQFNRVSQTPYNSISGDVSCMLGSEIIPYGASYIERRYQAFDAPLSTNERVEMLKQWRKMVCSKNPKLLKDMKGQSWIVQIFSSSNTPRNNVRYQPDQISFTWKQIAETENVIIVGEGYQINRSGQVESDWR